MGCLLLSLSKPHYGQVYSTHKGGGQSSGHLQFPAGTSSGLLEEHKSNKDLLRVKTTREKRTKTTSGAIACPESFMP